MHHAAEQHLDALAVPLQRHVAFDRLEFRPTGARDQRQQPFTDAVEGQHAGRVHIAQNADDARVLLIEADDHLRLDGAVAQPGNDRLLNFRYGSRRGGNFAGIGNIDAALLIDGLRRQIDEVAGTRACGLSGREQAARRGFKDRYIEDVADADDLVRLGRLSGNSPWNVTRLGCDRKPMVSALKHRPARKAAPHWTARRRSHCFHGVAFRSRPGSSEHAGNSITRTSANIGWPRRFNISTSPANSQDTRS